MPNSTPLPTGVLSSLADVTGLDRSLLSKVYHGHRSLLPAHIECILRHFGFADRRMLQAMEPCCVIAYCCSMLYHSNYLLHLMAPCTHH